MMMMVLVELVSASGNDKDTTYQTITAYFAGLPRPRCLIGEAVELALAAASRSCRCRFIRISASISA